MTAGSGYPLYTVPTGKVAVLKCTTGYVGAGGGILEWAHDGSEIFDFMQRSAEGTEIRTELGIVLPAGHSFSVFVASGTWQLGASGYLLDA